MTRYSRPADAKNPALDLSDRQAFQLDLDDGNGMASYPSNWFALARAAEIAKLGFTAYEPPPPPPPPDPAPETTPLSRRQFWDWLNGKFGVTKTQLDAQIATLPNNPPDFYRTRAANYVAHETFIDWDDPFCTWVRGKLAGAPLNIDDATQRTAWMQVANEVWA